MSRKVAIFPLANAGIPKETADDLKSLGFTGAERVVTHGSIDTADDVHLVGLPPLPEGTQHVLLQGFEPKPGDAPGEWTLFTGGFAATCIDLTALIIE